MASGISSYMRVLRLPGALRFSLSGLVARMPMSMVSLGIVLLVATRTGSYASASAVAASFLSATALFSIMQARLIDRCGQRRVLSSAAALFALGLAATMLCVELGLPAPWPHLCAAAAGAAMPQIGSSIRARWSHVVSDRADMHSAFSFEAVLDEVVFIAGPALVTALATVVHPLAGLSCAIVATVTGTFALVSQMSTEPPAGGRSARAGGTMPWRVLAPLIACAFAMGAILGAAEVATVAFSEDHGAAFLGGPMLAIWAVGSMVSGILTGAVHVRASNASRFRWGTLVLGVLVVPLPFVQSFVLLGVCLFVSGFGISPTLIAAFAWIEESVPSGRITEGITLFTTGLGAGLAPGAALTGAVVDRFEPSAGYFVAVVAGLAGVGVAFLAPMVRRVRVPTLTEPYGQHSS